MKENQTGGEQDRGGAMLEWESSHGNYNGSELYDPGSDDSEGDRKVRAADMHAPSPSAAARATAFAGER